MQRVAAVEGDRRAKALRSDKFILLRRTVATVKQGGTAELLLRPCNLYSYGNGVFVF